MMWGVGKPLRISHVCRVELSSNSSLLDRLPEEWRILIETASLDWEGLSHAVDREREKAPCYPPAGFEFEALRAVSPANVRAVICGQDPYHGPGQAHGLAFSVSAGVPHPPSLRNIIKEVQTDLAAPWPLGQDFDSSGALGHWSREGVLLLNDVLTVRDGSPGSHSLFGWQEVTGAILDAVSNLDVPIAILLWGKPAQLHAKRFTQKQHAVFEAPHPSPLSAYRGFWGSRHFSKANDWLEAHGRAGVNWLGSED